MAGFFSNHSQQSRFLANSTTSATTTSTDSAPPSSISATQQQPRSRAASNISKHFSTSVSSISPATSTTSETPERHKTRSPETTVSTTGVNVHPLRNTWVFWFRQQRAPGNKYVNYEEGIKKISSCSSVESFWALWTHLNPPSTLQPTTDYLLFHSSVHRPVWEDPVNIAGGKWVIRLKKGVADRVWEDLVLAVVGDQFDDCKGAPEAGGAVNDGGQEWPEICGCTISVRQHEDIISLWNRVDGDMVVRERIRDRMCKLLNLPPSIIMEFKSNNDSMTQDKANLRNAPGDRRL